MTTSILLCVCFLGMVAQFVQVCAGGECKLSEIVLDPDFKEDMLLGDWLLYKEYYHDRPSRVSLQVNITHMGHQLEIAESGRVLGNDGCWYSTVVLEASNSASIWAGPTTSVYFTEIGTSHVIIFTCLSDWDGNSCSTPHVWVGRRKGKEIFDTLAQHIEIMVEALCLNFESYVIQGGEHTACPRPEK